MIITQINIKLNIPLWWEFSSKFNCVREMFLLSCNSKTGNERYFIIINLFYPYYIYYFNIIIF